MVIADEDWNRLRDQIDQLILAAFPEAEAWQQEELAEDLIVIIKRWIEEGEHEIED